MKLAEILKALGNETRYDLVQLLVRHEYCVRALADHLNISESAVSQHLSVLRDAGLVEGHRRGYYIHYWVDRDALKDAAARITELANVTPCSFERSRHTREEICSAERRESAMAEKDKCKHPELRPEDGKCTDEQIKKCHGDEEKHTCDEKKPCHEKGEPCGEKEESCHDKEEPCEKCTGENSN